MASSRVMPLAGPPTMWHMCTIAEIRSSLHSASGALCAASRIRQDFQGFGVESMQACLDRLVACRQHTTTDIIARLVEQHMEYVALPKQKDSSV